MNTTRVLSLLLVLLAVFVFVVAMFFFFGKKGEKAEAEPEKKETTTATPVGSSAKVLNVVTRLSNDKVDQLKAGLGESFLFDARAKTRSYKYQATSVTVKKADETSVAQTTHTYRFGAVTVTVVPGELENFPGYTKFTHALPTPFKGQKVVFDQDVSHEFFEDPVTALTTYFFFDTLLFMTFTTVKEGEKPVTKYYHYAAHPTGETVRWDRFDRDATKPLDTALLKLKLDELNVLAGNLVVVNLDEYVEEATGTYKTTLNSVTSTFTVAKRSSSQTGFVKLTHKLAGPGEAVNARPFKLKNLNVSGTDLGEAVLTNKPVVTLSVFWWHNVPLLAELDLFGGETAHLAYNVDTNNWEKEVVEKLKSKLFLLKNKLGEPVTLDLSKVGKDDQTYTTNGTLVKVTLGATSASKDFTKYTHRFATGTAHFVGALVNAGVNQLGLPVMRLNEAAVYYYYGVPLLLKFNMATAGSLTTKHRFYANNGFGFWTLLDLTQEASTTEALLKKLEEENKKLAAENDRYVLDARLMSNYLSNGKLVEVTRAEFNTVPGYSLFHHTALKNAPFKFEKFNVGGKDVKALDEVLAGVKLVKVYWFMADPLLVHVQGASRQEAPEAANAAGTPDTPVAEFNHYFAYNATSKQWAKVEKELDTVDKVKAFLTELRVALGSVVLNLANNVGEFKSGHVTVTVTDATPYDNDPPEGYTKKVHTLSVPFPVDKVKHFDYDLVLAEYDASQRGDVPTNNPVVPKDAVVTKVELYFYGEVPLHFVVFRTHGAPLRYSNSFKGTVWRRDTYADTHPVYDVLLPLRLNLGAAAKLDLCSDVPANTTVTYRLRYLAAPGTVPVTLTKSEVAADGTTMLTHKLPENVTLKFTTLTCNDHLLTGLKMEDTSRILVYNKNRAPLFVKMNSDPRFFVMSGDGKLTPFLPPGGAADLTTQELAAKVTELSNKVGKVFMLDLAKKAEYTVQETAFTVESSELGGFKKFKHALKVEAEAPAAPFTVTTFLNGDREAVFFPTGLQVAYFLVFFKDDAPFYLQVKAHGESGKFYHYVNDRGLWLNDGEHAAFEEEELADRLSYLRDGLGNDFALDLSEDAENPLFTLDVVNYPHVPGYVKYTYSPKGLDYPLLLTAVTLGGAELNLPLTHTHVSLFTAYSYRKNYLLFHVVTHDHKNLFYKTNFEGGFVPLEFERFDDEALRKELFLLKMAVSNQVALEMARTASYPYHNFTVNVVKQTLSLENYDKYLHDLTDGPTSVPFKLVSAKDNGYVTNVPAFGELVYFAYVYVRDGRPLLLELHTSTKERNDYHHYYFANNVGNWELLENPSLAELPKNKLKEVLDAATEKLSKTYKVDLARKFSYRFKSPVNQHFTLDVNVLEDARETVGFSMYSQSFVMTKDAGAPENAAVPNAATLGAATVVPTVTSALTAGANTVGANANVVANAGGAGAAAGVPATGTAPVAPAGTTGAATPATTATTTPGTVTPTATTTETTAPTTTTTGTGAGVDTVPTGAVVSTAKATDGVFATREAGAEAAEGAQATTLNTYQLLKANALRGVNLMSANLPVVGLVTVGDTVVDGFAVDSLLKVNVYWWHDKFPALAHFYNGVDHKYYKRKGAKWVLARKVAEPLARSVLVGLLNDVKAMLQLPVELDLDKSSDFNQYTKYVSEGLTLKVVPTQTLDGGFKGFTHFSAMNYERAFKVARLTLWGDVVARDLPDGFVRNATVFTDADLLPLAVELEWTRLNNASLVKRYRYFKNTGVNGWVLHETDNHTLKLTDTLLVEFLKKVKEALGERVVLALDKRDNYGPEGAVVTVTNLPALDARGTDWKGYHKVTHAFNKPNAHVLMMKVGDRVLRTHHTPTYVKAVDTFWYKNVLLLVKLTVAGAKPEGAAQAGADTAVFYKNDDKDDLVLVDAPATAELVPHPPSPHLQDLALPFKDHFNLDVAERTLFNEVGAVKLLPALYVVDTAVPEGFARYNLYVLDNVHGLRLKKLFYHGRELTGGNVTLPDHNVYSVYAFTPVGHFSPLFLELHVRTHHQLQLFYYHLNQYGDWVKLETGGRRLTNEELYGKLSLLVGKLGNVTVVDVSKTEGTYFGLNKMNVSKFEFAGVRGYKKYLHKAHDGDPFTVSKFVNKGVVFNNLPVLKATHVAVYATAANKPLLLELRVAGKYKFFASSANGEWFEDRLPSGDLKTALDTVYDEHLDVARKTRDRLSLHLNANLVREYVLTEGNVGDFEGAVAVPDEEPEPERAPLAERLLPEEVEDPEAGDVEAPRLEGAARARVPAPAETLTRSHVLNPVLYVDPDNLAYTYASLGKTVYVARRDHLFRGYNVTLHRLANNEPFVLRRVAFLGREFDLGVADKLLSATLFSFLHAPLVLKLALLNGTEKFFEFDFATQVWAPLAVTDLELQLDALNAAQNGAVVVDLAKQGTYTLNEREFTVEKAEFAGYTKHSTLLSKVLEKRAKYRKKRAKVRAKRQKVKDQLKAEADEKKAALDVLKAQATAKKAQLDGFTAALEKLDPAAFAKFKELEAKVVALESLDKEVHELGAVLEATRGRSEDFSVKAKELEAKKAELVAKAKELEALQKEVGAPTKEDLEELELTDASQLKAALKNALAVAKGLKVLLKPHDKAKTVVDEVKKVKDYGTAQALKTATEALDAFKTAEAAEPLTEFVAAATKVGDQLDLHKTDKQLVKSVSGTGEAATTLTTDEVDKFTKATKEVEELKVVLHVAELLDDFLANEANVEDLSTKVDEATLVAGKLKLALAHANALLNYLLYDAKLNKLGEELKKLEDLPTTAETLKTAVDKLEVTGDHAANFNALKEALKKVNTFKEALDAVKVALDGANGGLPKLDEATPKVEAAVTAAAALKTAMDALTNLQGVEGDPLKALNDALTAAEKLKAADVFTPLKTAVEAFKTPAVAALPADTAAKVKAVDDAFNKVRALHEVATKLKEAVGALNVTEGTGAAKELKDAVAEDKVNKLKEAFEAVVKVKDVYENALDKGSHVDTAVTKVNDAVEPLKTLKDKMAAVEKLEDTTGDYVPKLKEAVKAAAKLKLDDPYTPLKTALEALKSVDVPKTETLYLEKVKLLDYDYKALLEELKPEGQKTFEMALTVAPKLQRGNATFEKVAEALAVAAKFAAAYDVVKDLDDQNQDAEKFKKAVEGAGKLKDALVGVDKLNEAYLGLVQLKAAVVTETKLGEAVDAAENFKAVFDVASDLKTAVAEVEKVGADTFEEGAAKTAVTKLKEHAEKLNLAPHVEKVKTVSEEVKTDLVAAAQVYLKLGFAYGRKKYKELTVQVVAAEKSHASAEHVHDVFNVDLDVGDSDDDTESLKKVFYTFGGLRFNGKDLNVAGLPVGGQVHTLNAFFVTGTNKPLVLQFKYSDVEDVDEPADVKLQRPPVADALAVPDRQTAAPATAPANQVNSAVTAVENLLTHAVSRAPTEVRAETVTVVAPAAPEAAAGAALPAAPGAKPPKAPRNDLAGPGAPAGDHAAAGSQVHHGHPKGVAQPFSYPGRFFTLELDGTWKTFVPNVKGALKAKLDELKVLHALGTNLDLGKAPGSRRNMTYVLNTQPFTVRRVLLANGHQLPDADRPVPAGKEATVKNVANLHDFDASVDFLPPLNFEWYVHHKPPTMGANNAVVDTLPAFGVEGLNFGGVPLAVDHELLATFTNVKSVSAVLNKFGVPLLVFLYSTTAVEGGVSNVYKALAFNGVKFVLDTTFANFADLLFKLEHTHFDWAANPAVNEFRAHLLDKLKELEAGLAPTYVLDLGATAHYQSDGVAVNVTVGEAFGVKHVSFAPGLVHTAEAGVPTTVPAFVLQKVFLGETALKGFNLPFKNVLHASAFFGDVVHPLPETVTNKNFEKFPVLVELSYRNEHNRLENFYYRYVGGDAFELLGKTKLRLTAAEVADVVRAVVNDNLHLAKNTVGNLVVDLALKVTHYTPAHKVAVEKFVRAPAALGAPPATPVVNDHVPEGFRLFKYTLNNAYTAGKLVFADFWSYDLTTNYTEFFAYVKENDTVPLLLALGYPEAQTGGGVLMKFDWVGLTKTGPAAVLAGQNVLPTSVATKAAVVAELTKLVAHHDFLLQHRLVAWLPVEAGLTVKLSPVGPVKGFPQVTKVPAPAPGVGAAVPPGAAGTTTTPGVSAQPAAPQAPVVSPRPATTVVTETGTVVETNLKGPGADGLAEAAGSPVSQSTILSVTSTEQT